tara:strand:+ start:1094 stop:1915 length:822 start_codon:yes stop_codon:yes gene_type:complete
MKTKIIKSSLVIAILGVALWSCKKDEVAPVDNTSIVEKSFSNQGFDKTQRILTQSEIDQYGIDHNNYLGILLDGIDVNNSNRLNILKQNMIQLDPNLANHNNEVDLFLDYSQNDSEIEGFNAFVDANSHLFNDANKLKLYVLNSTAVLSNCTNLANFSSELNILETSAKSELMGVDLDTYLVFSSVLKSSVSYWSSDENDYFDFMAQRPLGERVAIADGLSAAVGFFTLAAMVAGVSAAATGGAGTIGAIALVGGLLGVGFNSAVASTIAIFM